MLLSAKYYDVVNRGYVMDSNAIPLPQVEQGNSLTASGVETVADGLIPINF